MILPENDADATVALDVSTLEEAERDRRASRLLDPGTRLNDTYVIMEVLGSGGGGVVYKAFHERLRTYVVVKQIKERVRGILDSRGEADILKQIKHSNLPRVYDFLEADGEIYTVMDFVPGESLDKALLRQKRFSPKQVYRWALQLADALDYLHRQKPPIIHSDIKPANIMLTPDGSVCLIDFNISLAFDSSMRNSTGISQGYSPPEQYRSRAAYLSSLSAAADRDPDPGQKAAGERPQTAATAVTEAVIGRGIDERSDIYSLGCTLYHLLTGIRPSVNYDDIIPLRQFGLPIGEGFRVILEKMMELDPDRRYSNGMELNDALKHVYELDSEYIRYRKRNRIRTLIIAVLYLSGAVLTAAGVFTYHGERIRDYNRYVQQARQLIEDGGYDQAETFIENAIGIDEGRTGAYEQQVLTRYRQGKYEECLQKGLEVLNNPLIDWSSPEGKQTSADIFYLMGSACYEQEDYGGAVSYYRQAIDRNRENSLYFRDYAIALARTGYADEASEALDWAVSLGLGEDAIYIVQGEIAAAEGQDEEAAAYFDRCIRTSADDELRRRATLLLARTYERMGNDRIDQEIALLEEAVSRSGQNASLYAAEQLADAYVRKAESSEEYREEYYQKAIAAFTDLSERGYETRQILENIAILYQQTDQLEAAEEVLAGMADKYPDDYRVYKRYALLEAEKQQKKENQERDYSRMAEYYQTAARLYASSGDGSDTEMQMLGNMIRELRDGGWFDGGDGAR